MLRNRGLCAAACIVLAGTPAPAEHAEPRVATVYVAANGNDVWSGKLAAPNVDKTDGPLATLEGARDAVRKLKVTGATVLVRAGVYRLRQTFTLDKRDSGTAYRAYPGERPVLSGAWPITGFVPHKGKILKADVAALGLKGVYFRQLFCSGRRQELARYPNADPELPVTGGWAFVPGKPGAFYANREGGEKRILPVAPEILHAWARPEDGEVFIFARFNWNNHIVGIKSVDRENHTLALASPVRFAPAPDDRFFLRNLFEELDAPGEWFLDKRTWTLYFWPPLDAKTMAVEAPRVRDMIRIDRAERITIQGFIIERCDANGVLVRNCTECRVAANTIRQVGGYCASHGGVNISGGHRNGAVGNDIYDTGADAIALNGGDYKTLAPAENYADNNYLHHLGAFKRHAKGVIVSGVGNRVSHNLIHDSPRTGITGSGNDHVIELNRIRHVNLQTEDTGGIYLCGATTGFCRRGHQVRYNFVSDSLGFGRRHGQFRSPFYAHGIYLDDTICGHHVYGNIIVRTTSDPMFIHGGSDNVVENNIIVDSGKGQMLWSQWWPPESLWPRIRKNYEKYGRNPAYFKYPHFAGLDLEATYKMQNNSFLRNIVYYRDPKRSAYRHRKLPLDKTHIDYNVIYSSGQPVVCGLPGVKRKQQWAEWQKLGLDTHSVIADPQFVDHDHDDYRLKPTSPALKLGFKAIPVDKIGPYESPLRASWPISEAQGAREHPLVLEQQPAPKPKARPFTVRKVGKAIVVDGVVSPNEWPRETMALKQHPSGYSSTKQPCTANVCHDGQRLYVAVTVPVSDAAKLKLGAKWGDSDAAEVCLATGKGPIFVVHGYANGTHESVCEAGASAHAAAKLGAATQFAARAEGKQWTGEWSIPFAPAGIAPKPEAPIMFNLGVRRTETREWIVWVGTGGSTWEVEGAGTLVLE